MKCPICNTKTDYGTVRCPKCGFDDLRYEFINIAEAEEWKRNSVGAYLFSQIIPTIEQKNHKLASLMREELDLTYSILSKFFREDSHIYSLDGVSVKTDNGNTDNIRINTKYVIIASQTMENNVPTMRQSILGNQLLAHRIEVEKGVVEIYANLSSGNQRVAVLSNLTQKQLLELRLVLSLAKMPDLFFEYPFDDALIPNESVLNPEEVWDSWFDKDDGFYGIKTYVYRTNHDEMGGKDETSDDVLTLEFSFTVTDKDEFFAVPLSQKFKMLKYINVQITTPNGEKTRTAYVPDSLSNEIYLNREKNSIFIGSQHEYECWEFVEDGMSQKVFNYLATLCDSLTQMDLMMYLM